MDNDQTPFSWFTIETDERGTYHLFNNNQKGIYRLITKSRDLEYIDTTLSRREEQKARMEEVIARAIQKVRDDPEALRRLKINHKG